MRLQRLQAALNRDQHAFNRASVGRVCDVLIERRGMPPFVITRRMVDPVEFTEALRHFRPGI